MPLAGGIVCGDVYPCVLPAGVWVTGLLLFAGMLVMCYRYAFRRMYGAVAFLFFFGLGGSLVSRQLGQTEFVFPEESAVYQVTLQEDPEIKEHSLLYRAVLQGEVRKDTLLHNSRKNVFLLYFPKDTLAYSLQRGDELLIKTRLSPPANNGNPDEFDYARYLVRKGGSGTAYVSAGHWQVVGRDSSRTLRQVALDYRKKVVALYRGLGFGGDELAVLSALTVGDKDELSEEITETYSATGASHVLALSGLHIGFLYALMLFLLSPLWRRWHCLKPFLLLLILLLLWSFAFFTGLSSSVVRSAGMFSLLAFSTFQLEKPLTLNTLAATAFLMLLFNPVWLFDAGFQLSFSAVAAILLLQPKLYGLWTVRNRFLRYAWALMTVSVAAQVGTAPLVILYFSRFPTHFLLTNLGVIPLVSLIMYAAVLLLLFTPFPFIQQAFAKVVDALVQMQNAMLRYIEQLPFASVDSLWMDVWSVVLFYLCVWWAYRAFARHTVANVYIALSVLFLGASRHTAITMLNAPQRGIAFYNVRGCPAVHCLADNSCSWLVCADSLADTSRLQRTLAPHWTRLHLQRPVMIDGDYAAKEVSVQSRIISYGGKRICMLCDNRWRHKTADAPLPVDYLYVSKGYKGDIKELASLFTVDTVVLDASLSDYYQDRIINDCIRLGISYLSLSKKGSVRILL